MKFLTLCWTVAVMIAGPGAVQAGCYATATYYKQAAPAYVAPPYQPAVSVFLVPAVPVYSLGPGYAAYAPPPPPAVAAAPAVAPCDAKIAALAAEFKLLREENQALKLEIQRQRQQPVPQQQPAPRQAEPAPPAKAAVPAPGDLSWLTGEKGCAACHGGPEPVKGIDYSKGLEALNVKQLGRTIKVLDAGTMPPEDPKEYAKHGVDGPPHQRPTKEQLAAFSARLEEMRK